MGGVSEVIGVVAAFLQLVGVRGFVGLALGLSLMAGWERLPWGLKPRLDAAQAEVTRKAKALNKAASALRTAAQAIKDRDKAITDNANGEAVDAGAMATFWKGQCRAAFDAGFAARRCSASGPAGDVRDLRDVWGSGAWTSAGRVPVEPRRGDR